MSPPPEPTPTGPELVTMGEVMGLLLAPAGVPLPAARSFDLGFAGAECTVAVGVRRLGHPSALITGLGADSFGDHIARELRAEQVELSGVLRDEQRPTGLLVRDAPAGRPITVEYRRSGSAASALSPADVSESLISSARVLHLTGITSMLSSSAHDAVVHAARLARDAGVTICLDPNVRLRLGTPEQWRAVIDELAGYADIVLVGADEAAHLSSSAAHTWFAARGASTVVVKDGERGAYEIIDGQRIEQGVFGVPLVDPVGAGDAFAAGWLAAWLEDASSAERLRRGAAVAACSVAVRGDVAGLPDRATLEAILGNNGDVRR
ncbi:sugar kinase [Epidermidibacterium keratini]|uniref:Sugar kinase n=1 Tax=Epidermidibacterium keratini TaxID=1891644 RepID=A0A7L4YPZ6_9ACTN|nr:sugar kinase [Epidermidibacterium keratini]QHC00627.1 sugar kinase [Epidermidibacterium keratini]